LLKTGESIGPVETSSILPIPSNARKHYGKLVRMVKMRRDFCDADPSEKMEEENDAKCLSLRELLSHWIPMPVNHSYDPTPLQSEEGWNCASGSCGSNRVWNIGISKAAYLNTSHWSDHKPAKVSPTFAV
jgi:hypothetical protein